MGNAKIWYYPDGLISTAGEVGVGTLEEIDLGECLSNIEEEQVVESESSRTWDGRVYSSTQGGRLRVRFTLERTQNEDLANQLKTLQSHLKLGGYMSIAADSDVIFGGFLTDIPTRGDNGIGVTDNPFQVYNTSATTPTGTRFTIASPAPEYLREYTQLVSATGPQHLTFDQAINYTRQVGPVVCRAQDFYPVMQLAPDQRSTPIVTHDHRISWTMDMLLEEDMSAYVKLFDGALNNDLTADPNGTLDAAVGFGAFAGDTGSRSSSGKL